MQKKLANSLENIISGQVTDKKEFLDFYSLDSSAYSKRPKVIVFPDTIDDIKKTVRFAKKRKIPICARGGSTGLVGSSLTTGIILDMKNFNKINTIFENLQSEPYQNRALGKNSARVIS